MGRPGSTWYLDLTSATLIVLVAGTYAWCYRRAAAAHNLSNRHRPDASASASSCGPWPPSVRSAAYAYVLFWVRALQVLLLLYVVPFFLAQGKPITVGRNALGPRGRERVDRLLGSRWARVLAHPLTTSLAMLATPWLLYLTPWYTAALQNQWIGALTRIMSGSHWLWILLCPAASGPGAPQVPATDFAADLASPRPSATESWGW